MNYEIKITKREPNPDYKPPKTAQQIYRESYDIPRELIHEVLSIEITEEQYKAIKKAALEVF